MMTDVELDELVDGGGDFIMLVDEDEVDELAALVGALVFCLRSSLAALFLSPSTSWTCGRSRESI